MATHVLETSQFADQSPLLVMEYSATSQQAAPIYLFPELVAEPEAIHAGSAQNGGCMRGVRYALALEALAGVGIYAIWTLFHVAR